MSFRKKKKKRAKIMSFMKLLIMAISASISGNRKMS